MSAEIWQGIVVGTIGGIFAGIVVGGMSWLARLSLDKRDQAAIRRCLKQASVAQGKKHFPAVDIANWAHLPVSRVEILCSTDKRIAMGWIKREKQVWGLRD